MIAHITILTSLVFAVLYPLCFLISWDEPLKNNFHRFHTGLPTFVAGVLMVYANTSPMDLNSRIWITVWAIALCGITWFYWTKEFPHPLAVSFTSAIGVIAFYQLQAGYIAPGGGILYAGLLGGCIFCASLFAINLGHWYLNVHGLNIKHLRRTHTILWSLLGFRLLWNIFHLTTGTIVFSGEEIPLWAFTLNLDGYLIWVAILFGTLFPFTAMFFARGTLDLKNTQATTGILYVILCSVLLGDMAYKYYLIHYGLIL